jgi:hypothetical protein
MSEQSVYSSDLERLIGQCVEYQGQSYRIVDYLLREQTLILRQDGTCLTTIQSDQFGTPTRRVPETVEYQLFDPDNGVINPEVIQWLAALENHP